MDQQEAYKKKMEAKLKEWDAEIDKMRAKAEQKEAEARIEALERVDELKAKRKALEDKMLKMKQTGGEAWDELSTGLENASQELRLAFDKAKQKFGL